MGNVDTDFVEQSSRPNTVDVIGLSLDHPQLFRFDWLTEIRAVENLLGIFTYKVQPFPVLSTNSYNPGLSSPTFSALDDTSIIPAAFTADRRLPRRDKAQQRLDSLPTVRLSRRRMNFLAPMNTSYVADPSF